MSSNYDDFQARYEVGKPAFDKLFAMPFEELKKVLREICGSANFHDNFFTEATVKKISTDDNPTEIDLYYYSKLSVTPFGIYYEPEHGNSKLIFEFTRFFKI